MSDISTYTIPYDGDSIVKMLEYAENAKDFPTEISALKSKDTEIEKTLKDLKSSSSQHSIDIINLQSKDNSLNARINELVAEDVQIHKLITSLEEKDKDFEAKDKELNCQINEKIIGNAVNNFKTTKISIDSFASELTTIWDSSTFTLGRYTDFQSKIIKSISFVGVAGKTMKVILYDSATAESIIAGTTSRTIVKEILITTDGLQTHELNIFCPSDKVLAVNCASGAKYKGRSTAGANQECYRITASSTTYHDNLTLGLGVEYCTYSAIEDCQVKIDNLREKTICYKVLNPYDYETLLSNVQFPVMCTVDVAAGWTDLPNGITSGVLINYQGNNSAILQTLHTYAGSKSPQIYQRVITATSAENWTYLGKYEASNSIMYQTLNAAEYDGKTSKILFPYMGNLARASGWTDLPRSDMGQGIILNVKGLNNVFLQFCFDFGTNRTYQRVISSSSEGVWTEMKAIPSTSIETYTTGKKCGCLGDSITYGLRGTSWVTKLSEYCGFAEVINYGISGSQISGKYPDGMLNRYSSMRDDLDYIVVFGGVNDFMWSLDSKDTFRTNYENLIVGLLNKFPAAKILGVTPMKFEFTETAEGIRSRKWSTARTDGIVLKDYRDIEVEILDKYSIPCLDLFACSGISPEIPAQANTYFYSTQDHLHPNTNGNIKILAPKIAEALKRI